MMMIFWVTAAFVLSLASAFYPEMTCFCSVEKCRTGEPDRPAGTCRSIYGCYSLQYQQQLVIAACIQSNTQNRTHCGEDELYRQSSPESTIQCCVGHMCNRLPAPSDVQLVLPYDGDFDDGQLEDFLIPADEPSDQSVIAPPSGEFWFRVAVIAVPITGAFILVILVIIAVRMIRQDQINHKMLANQRIHTLSALHRGCTENYCHLSSVPRPPDTSNLLHSHNRPDSTKQMCYSKLQLNTSYPLSAKTHAQSVSPGSLSVRSGPDPNGNHHKWSSEDYAPTKAVERKALPSPPMGLRPLVTRPPDICECHKTEPRTPRVVQPANHFNSTSLSQL